MRLNVILLPVLIVTFPALATGQQPDSPLLGFLALALTSSLRGWPWPLRLTLHAGWLCCLGLLAAQARGLVTQIGVTVPDRQPRRILSQRVPPWQGMREIDPCV